MGKRAYLYSSKSFYKLSSSDLSVLFSLESSINDYIESKDIKLLKVIVDELHIVYSKLAKRYFSYWINRIIELDGTDKQSKDLAVQGYVYKNLYEAIKGYDVNNLTSLNDKILTSIKNDLVHELTLRSSVIDLPTNTHGIKSYITQGLNDYNQVHSTDYTIYNLPRKLIIDLSEHIVKNSKRKDTKPVIKDINRIINILNSSCNNGYNDDQEELEAYKHKLDMSSTHNFNKEDIELVMSNVGKLLTPEEREVISISFGFWSKYKNYTDYCENNNINKHKFYDIRNEAIIKLKELFN